MKYILVCLIAALPGGWVMAAETESTRASPKQISTRTGNPPTITKASGNSCEGRFTSTQSSLLADSVRAIFTDNDICAVVNEKSMEPSSISSEAVESIREKCNFFGPRPSEPARELEELRVTAEARRFVETHWQERNEPFELLVIEYTMLGVLPELASAGADQIETALARAARAIAADNLATAIKILDDPALLDGTGFWMVAKRDRIDIRLLGSGDERSVAEKMRDLQWHRWGLSSDRSVSMPHAPSGVGSAQTLRFAQREWLRVAFEEIGHVAQHLRWKAAPNAWPLSPSMRKADSALAAAVAFEARRLREQDRRTEDSPLPSASRLDFNQFESDIYAYMIELLGHGFVPTWFGEISGYRYRRVIDAYYSKKLGVDRAWAKIP